MSGRRVVPLVALVLACGSPTGPENERFALASINGQALPGP